jgi:hypothetical protein
MLLLIWNKSSIRLILRLFPRKEYHRYCVKHIPRVATTTARKTVTRISEIVETRDCCKRMESDSSFPSMNLKKQ